MEQGILWVLFTGFLCCSSCIQKMTKFSRLIMQKEIIFITPPTEHSLIQDTHPKELINTGT